MGVPLSSWAMTSAVDWDYLLKLHDKRVMPIRRTLTGVDCLSTMPYGNDISDAVSCTTVKRLTLFPPSQNKTSKLRVLTREAQLTRLLQQIQLWSRTVVHTEFAVLGAVLREEREESRAYSGRILRQYQFACTLSLRIKLTFCKREWVVAKVAFSLLTMR